MKCLMSTIFSFFFPFPWYSGMHSRYDTTAKHSVHLDDFFPANFNSIALVFQTISIEHIVQIKYFVLPPSWTVTDRHHVVMSAAAAEKQRTITQWWVTRWWCFPLFQLLFCLACYCLYLISLTCNSPIATLSSEPPWVAGFVLLLVCWSARWLCVQFSYQRSCRGRRVRSQRCTWAWRCRRRSQLCFHTQSLRRSCGFAKHIHQRLQGNTDKRTEWLETSCCHVGGPRGRTVCSKSLPFIRTLSPGAASNRCSRRRCASRSGWICRIPQIHCLSLSFITGGKKKFYSHKISLVPRQQLTEVE